MTQLITDEYKKIQEDMHKDNPDYGTVSKRYVSYVMQLANDMNTQDILDYGCGKGVLQQNIPFTIQQYDPAMPSFSHEPKPADLVLCGDVLEHVEPECIDNVIQHLKQLTKRVGLFIIHGGPAKKTLPDGRNAHLIIEDGAWWFNKLSECFTITSYTLNSVVDEVESKEYIFLVTPK